MKLFAVAAALLIAETVLAAPAPALQYSAEKKSAIIAKLRARNQARRGSRFKKLGEEFTNGTATTVQSGNWGGAAIVATGVTQVTGTFVVPKPTKPSGGSSSTEYCGAAWVGIDGYNDDDLIQTGVLWCVQGSSFLYEAWTEYLPASLIEYSPNIAVTSGQSVTVTATKTGSNAGTTTLKVSGGSSGTHTFSGQSQPIPGDSAEWIVEDFESGGSEVPFANFGTVTFTGCSAIINGVTQTPGGDNAVNIELVENSQLTTTTISGSTVTVVYD
jgi:hypothetical protein